MKGWRESLLAPTSPVYLAGTVVKEHIADNQAGHDGRAARLRLIASLLLGVLCSLGFAPHNVWWLPVLCLAIWLHLVLRAKNPGSAALGGLVFGIGLYFAGMSWIFAGVQSHDSLPLAMLGPTTLLLMLAAQPAIVAVVLHRLRHRPVFALTACTPAVWIALEWARHHGEIPFPWLCIGYSQIPSGWLSAWTPIVGILGVSAAILLTSGLLAMLLAKSTRKQASQGLLIWILSSIAVAQTATIWTSEQGGHLKASLLQTSVPGNTKFDAEQLTKALRTYDDLIRSSQAQLVVMPETAWPAFIDDIPQAAQASVTDHATRTNADVIVSHLQRSEDRPGYFTVARSIGVSGEQVYRKRVLLPFGDYVPYPSLLRAPYEAITRVRLLDTLPGPDESQSFIVAGSRLALRMCYESLFGNRHREEIATSGAIVELANADWFDRHEPLHQHLQIAQARAMESGRSVIRAANTGITAWITPDGKIQDSLSVGATGRLDISVPLRAGVTPYLQFGDLIPLTGACLSLAAGIMLPATRRNSAASTQDVVDVAVNKQRGQALPIGLFFLFVCAGLMYFMFNSGQAITEKMRVTNAADMAAYSVGIEEARALNYDAYVNRTIVANQIAIAQTLSLQSWLHYFSTAVDLAPVTAAYVVRYFAIPSGDSLEAALFAAELAGTAYLDAYTGGQTLDTVIQATDVAAPVLIAAHNAASIALALTQEAVHLSLTLGISQLSLANDVVKEVDPTLSAQVALLSYDFDGFTKNYSKSSPGGDGRGRLADVVTRSRDSFTADRSWTLNGASVWGIQKDVALKKRGGTELVNYDEWKAMDTLEGHAREFGCGKYGLSWCGDIRQPLGYGAAQAGTNGGAASPWCGKFGGAFCGGQNIGGSFGGSYAENSRTAGFADQNLVDNGSVFSGLPGTRELSNLSPSAPQSTGITVMVSKSTADLATSGGSSNAKPTGRLQLFNASAPGDRMVALSRAEIYFERPTKRADGREELPSLYNPYWTVRLVAPTTADKAWAAAQQGGRAIPLP